MDFKDLLTFIVKRIIYLNYIHLIHRLSILCCMKTNTENWSALNKKLQITLSYEDLTENWHLSNFTSVLSIS